jgi:hypothetical protein
MLTTLTILAEARRADLLYEAERERLLKRARPLQIGAGVLKRVAWQLLLR